MYIKLYNGVEKECRYLYGGLCGKRPSPLWRGSFFVKPFRTMDELIQKLKDRGMTIRDEEFAKKCLLSNTYYNVINGYSKYFPRMDEKYIAGTSFDEVWQLYLYDKEVKQAFFEALLLAETHIKSIFAHHFAETFRDIPYAYLNINSYQGDVLDIVATISRLSNEIKRQRSIPGSSIRHYIACHNDVPIWVLVNHIDFGEFVYMLSESRTSVQNKVSRSLCGFIEQNLGKSFLFAPEVMISFVQNMRDVRNVCAHDNRLLGFRCRRDSNYWAPLHDRFGITPDIDRRNVFSVFVSLQCFLSISEYGALHNKILKRSNHLGKHLQTITLNDILRTLGFPENWNRNAARIST